VAGSALNDAQVAEVLNWVLKNFSRHQLPSNFKPYTEAEVAKYRAHELNDIKRVRGGLARKLASEGIQIPPED
ncbi:MAG: c-type cytochrome, partial [Candidatus Binataceae bacterium]